MPEPCVPSADKPVGQDKVPGMVDVEEPVPLKVAQLLQLLAFEKLYPARDVARASPALKSSEQGTIVTLLIPTRNKRTKITYFL